MLRLLSPALQLIVLLLAAGADARPRPVEPQRCRPPKLSESALSPADRKANGEEVRHLRFDLDGDGRIDPLTVTSGGGSGMWGTTATASLSADGLRIEVVHDVSFYGFVNETVVPRALLAASKRPVREAIEDILFGTMCDGPDPSLSRLLYPQRRLQWVTGPPSMPRTYTILVRSRRAISDYVRRTPDFRGPRPRALWRTYLGHNHDRPQGTFLFPRELARRKTLALLATAHGVIVADYARRRHAWLYIHPGGDKLRFPSIEAAVFDGNDARISVRPRAVSGGQKIVVDLTTGRTKRSGDRP